MLQEKGNNNKDQIDTEHPEASVSNIQKRFQKNMENYK